MKFYDYVGQVVFFKYPHLGDTYDKIKAMIEEAIMQYIYEMDSRESPFQELRLVVKSDKYIHPLVIRLLIHNYKLDGWIIKYIGTAIDTDSAGNHIFNITRKLGE